MDNTKKNGKNIQSVQRAIDILNCFSAAEPALSLGEISARLNLNKATVHGILNTLHNNDYVCQNSSGHYLLGRAIFLKAALANSSTINKLLDCIAAPLQTTCNQFSASGFVLTTENNNLQRIHMATPTNCAFVLQPVAQIGPLYAMASGKLMLAYADEDFVSSFFARTELTPLATATITSEEKLRKELERIRKSGYSFERDELAEGVASIAVPILNQNKTLCATISLTGMTSNISHKKADIVPTLQKIVKAVNGLHLYL